MKITTIKSIVYGALILGLLVMFFPFVIMPYSETLTVFMYIGGALSVGGMIFSLLCLRRPGCQTCHCVVFQAISANNCPHCGGDLT